MGTPQIYWYLVCMMIVWSQHHCTTLRKTALKQKVVADQKIPLPDYWKWWKFFPHFTWLLINSLDRDTKWLQCHIPHLYSLCTFALPPPKGVLWVCARCSSPLKYILQAGLLHPTVTFCQLVYWCTLQPFAPPIVVSAYGAQVIVNICGLWWNACSTWKITISMHTSPLELWTYWLLSQYWLWLTVKNVRLLFWIQCYLRNEYT